MRANSESSGGTAWMRRLAWAFAGCICDKYHNVMSWLHSWPISTKEWCRTRCQPDSYMYLLTAFVLNNWAFVLWLFNAAGIWSARMLCVWTLKSATGPVAQLVDCPLRGTGGHGFDPGPRHTKVVENGTSCSSPDTQTYGEELGLVDPLLG